MVGIQSPTAENRRKKDERRKKEEETTGRKYNGLPYHIVCDRAGHYIFVL